MNPNMHLDQDAPPDPMTKAAEPEVPDPFQLDDPDDPVSDEEDAPSTPVALRNPSQVTIIAPPVTEVSLHALPKEPQSTPFAPAPSATTKPQPALPEGDGEEDEDDPHALYLPGLTVPGLFLPIPNVYAPAILKHTPLTLLPDRPTEHPVDQIRHRPESKTRQRHLRRMEEQRFRQSRCEIDSRFNVISL
jgi:hypothetical protein